MLLDRKWAHTFSRYLSLSLSNLKNRSTHDKRNPWQTIDPIFGCGRALFWPETLSFVVSVSSRFKCSFLEINLGYFSLFSITFSDFRCIKHRMWSLPRFELYFVWWYLVVFDDNIWKYWKSEFDWSRLCSMLVDELVFPSTSQCRHLSQTSGTTSGHGTMSHPLAWARCFSRHFAVLK